MRRFQRWGLILLLYSMIGLDLWMIRDYFDAQSQKIHEKIAQNHQNTEKSEVLCKNTVKIDKILKNTDKLELDPDFLRKKRFMEQIPWAVPLSNYYISSHYGKRRDPVTRRRAMHRGIDLAANKGTKVRTPLGGRVFFAGRNGRLGKTIKIRHENGFTTTYGHLFRIFVKKGQHVVARQNIGAVGKSGKSTGYHLHYEVKYRNKHKNPYHFFVIGEFLTTG